MAITLFTSGSESGFMGLMPPGSRDQQSFAFNATYNSIAYLYCGPARTISAVQLILATGAGTPPGSIRIRVETSSNGAPSGTLATGAVEETFTPVLNSAVTCTLANQVALSAYVSYWIVVSNASATPTTNYFSTRFFSGSWLGNCSVRALIKSTASWSPVTSPSHYTGARILFADGSEFWPSPVGASAKQTYWLAYGGGGVRHSFYVPAPLWVDTLWVSMYRGGAAAPNLSWALTNVTDSVTLASGTIDINIQESNSTIRPYGIMLEPVLLLPGKKYRLTLTAAGGSASLFWCFRGDSDDAAYVGAPRQESALQTITETSSDGTTWTATSAIYPFAISFVGIGDTSGWGSMLLDSTTRDGASGYSVQMRAADSLRVFSYRRWMPVTVTGSKTYSVKMRRSSTAADQPALQQVRLLRASDMSVLATLSADANANGAFYAYTTSAISLTAGDVVIISYESQLGASQTSSTQGLAWFDSESWS